MDMIICFLGSQISKIDLKDFGYEIFEWNKIKIINFHKKFLHLF